MQIRKNAHITSIISGIFILFSALFYLSECYQISDTCTDGNYFDTTLLECTTCPTGMVASSDGFSCTCPVTSIMTSYVSQTVSTGSMVDPQCVACSSVSIK